MPELPDVQVYSERLTAYLRGRRLARIDLRSPFLLRTVEPRPDVFAGRAVEDVARIGKRLVLRFEDDLFAVIHLMIAGRLRWRATGARVPRTNLLATFEFPEGTVLFTEASKRKRASLHLVRGRAELSRFDRGGLDLASATQEEFMAALTRENHTLKRALTDPTILDGIGNAYSDEILHAAKLSPFKQNWPRTLEELEDRGR